MRTAILAFALATAACGRTESGPLGTLTLSLSKPDAATASVRLTVSHSDDAVATDTTVSLSGVAVGSSLAVSIRVRLRPNPPANGEEMKLMLRYLNSSGSTIFQGTTTVVVRPG